jgi:hypothetical protein
LKFAIFGIVAKICSAVQIVKAYNISGAITSALCGKYSGID